MDRAATVQTIWVDDFLASCERRALSPRTLGTYRQVLLNLAHKYRLDLAHCSREEMVAVFDSLRRQRSVPYYVLNLTLSKMVLHFLKRQDLVDVIEYPQMPDRSASIMKKLLTREERDKLIRKAPTLQDRLIFELLDETGARKGELYKLRVKDVQFEVVNGTLTAILMLSGKTGTRRRRVYASAPDLREQVNNCPHRDNPDSPILRNQNGDPLTLDAFYHRVRDQGWRILKRRIHPHQFRHSRATEDSKLFTDRELMMMFGWTNPTMVGIYSHLSLRDVDEKDLVLHGLKKREEILRPLLHTQRCKCGFENSPIAIYCAKCGLSLTQQESEQIKQLTAQLSEVTEFMAAVKSGKVQLHKKN